MPIRTPFRRRLPKSRNPPSLPVVERRLAVPRPQINERVHRTAAHGALAEGQVRTSPDYLADHDSPDRDPVSSVCTEVRRVPFIPGIAAADHSSFRAGPARANLLCFLWHVHRFSAGFAIASAHWDVWYREDPGGLLRGVRQPAIRRGKPDCNVHPELLLLFFPPVLLLGSGARIARRGDDLRRSANATFWATKCSSSPAVVPHFG